ncbi:hypothetical protein T06_10873 [Trichinella sp. T6]|nr:hypothetical protein T06_10873 [Trichinella sp. T6]
MVWKFINSTWACDLKFVLTSGLTTRLFGSFLALFLWHSSQNCQLSVISAWRLPCELHNADRSAMTHLAFKRDIAAHLL